MLLILCNTSVFYNLYIFTLYRGGYKDRKKAIIKEWTKSNTTPPTSSSAAHGSSASSSIVDPGAIAVAHASLSTRPAHLGSSAVPSTYNDYYTAYGASGGKEDAASAQLREYYGHHAQQAAQAAYYAAQDPLYNYAAAAAAVGNLHPGNHPHHLAAAVAR